MSKIRFSAIILALTALLGAPAAAAVTPAVTATTWTSPHADTWT